MGRLLDKLRVECPLCGIRDFHLRMTGRYSDEKGRRTIYLWECVYCAYIWKQKRILRDGQRDEVFATGVTHYLNEEERSKLAERLELRRRELEEHYSLKPGVLSHIPTAADDVIYPQDADSDLRSALDRLRDNHERFKDSESAH